MQEDHLIGYENWKLDKRECLKSTYDKDMLAIIHELAKWQQYLLGSKFLIHTDANSLQYLLWQKLFLLNKQKWIEKISTFDIEILRKEGKDNLVVDALSQKDEDVTTYVTLIVIHAFR